MINYVVLSLGEIIREGCDIQIIEEIFKKFSCQRETDLENFLNKRAITYEKADHGKTYLIVDKDKLENNEFVVVAYFTIANTSVDISKLPKKGKEVL